MNFLKNTVRLCSPQVAVWVCLLVSSSGFGQANGNNAKVIGDYKGKERIKTCYTILKTHHLVLSPNNTFTYQQSNRFIPKKNCGYPYLPSYGPISGTWTIKNDTLLFSNSTNYLIRGRKLIEIVDKKDSIQFKPQVLRKR